MILMCRRVLEALEDCRRILLRIGCWSPQKDKWWIYPVPYYGYTVHFGYIMDTSWMPHGYIIDTSWINIQCNIMRESTSQSSLVIPLCTCTVHWPAVGWAIKLELFHTFVSLLTDRPLLFQAVLTFACFTQPNFSVPQQLTWIAHWPAGRLKNKTGIISHIFWLQQEISTYWHAPSGSGSSHFCIFHSAQCLSATTVN